MKMGPDSEQQVLLPTLNTEEGTSETQLEIDASSRGEPPSLTNGTLENHTCSVFCVCGCLAAA